MSTSPAPAPRPRFLGILFPFVLLGAVGAVFALAILFQPKGGAPPAVAEPKLTAPPSPPPETADQKKYREQLAALLADLRSEDIARRKAVFHADRQLNWLLFLPTTHVSAEQRTEAFRVLREQYQHPDPGLRLLVAKCVDQTCYAGQNAEHLTPDELLPACERLFREESGVPQVEAALIHWRHSRSPVSGKVLTDAIADRKRDAAARVLAAWAGGIRTKAIQVKVKEPHYVVHIEAEDAVRPDGYPDLLKRVLTDAHEPAELRVVACRVLRSHALFATAFHGEFSDITKGLLADVACPAPVLEAACDACATNWLELALAQKRAGVTPDVPDSFDGFVRAMKPLHALTAALALDRKRPTAVRLAALRSLDGSAPVLRERHPAVLQRLERAFTDADESAEIRVAAAGYAPLATAADFATLVRAADEDATPKRELRRALLLRLETATNSGQTPRPEWANDDVLARLVRISHALAPAQRTYDEPDLSGWYRAVLRERGAGAVAALRAGLTEAHALDLHLDALTELARTDRAATRPAIPEVAAVLEIKRNRCEELYAAREKVCAFLLLHGPDAKAALPGIGKWVAQRCGHPPGHERYLQVYIAVGGDPVPLLVGMLTLGAEDWYAKQFAVRQLGILGPAARAAAPALCDAVRAALKANGDPDALTTALAQLGPDVLPEVKKLTDDLAPEVQAAGADVLGKMGPECRSTATPILRKLYRDVKDSRVQTAALNALEKVHPDEAFRLRHNQ